MGIYFKQYNHYILLFHVLSALMSILLILLVKQELKQSRGFSATFFSIFVNDLAQDIKMANCGIKVDNIDISILVYA